jgi:hypothetical protein
VQWHQEHPWGTPENHPGALGKAAHIFSQIGNIAGDVLAPSVMANIPGTQLGMEREEGTLAKQVNDEQAGESLNRERNATAGHTEAETPEVAPNAASTRGVQGATAAHLNAETEGLENPQPQYEYQQTDHGLLAIDKKTGQARPVTLNGEPVGAKPSTSTPPHITSMLHGQPHIMERDPETGEYSIDRGVAPPSYAAMMPLVLGSKTATFIDPQTNLPTEQQFNPKTGTYDRPLGLSASNAYGHEAAQAGAVERSGNTLIQTIQANRDKIGTVGAWIKKNGLNTPMADPTLEGIRTEIASFAALNPAMHGARGAQAMQHFEDLIGGVQQNPDATIAGIHGLIRGAAQPILGQNQGPKVGDVEGGYRFKGGNAADKNSWEKVTK